MKLEVQIADGSVSYSINGLIYYLINEKDVIEYVTDLIMNPNVTSIKITK